VGLGLGATSSELVSKGVLTQNFESRHAVSLGMRQCLGDLEIIYESSKGSAK